MKPLVTALSATLLTGAAIAVQRCSPRQQSQRSDFMNPADGGTVASPATVNMGVTLCSTERENTGHPHLMLDRSPRGEGAGSAEMRAACR